MSDTMLPAALLAALSSAVGSVSGCHMRRHVSIRPSKSGRPGIMLYELSVDGWSPTLHEIDMTWTVEVDPDGDIICMEAAALLQIERHLVLQRRRAQAGLEIGIAWPYKNTSGRTVAIDHLSVDASSLVLAILPSASAVTSRRMGVSIAPGMPAWNSRTGVEVAVADLRSAIADLHRNATKAGGGRSITHGGATIHETGGMRQLEFGQRIPLSGGRAGRSGASLYGSSITIEGVVVPEAAVAAAAGRRVSDVAAIHPAVDSRRIASLRQEAGTLHIALEPCRVVVGDYTDMLVDDALPLLGRIVGDERIAEAA